MSYTFSRRDFMKYSALTAVAVAGAGMFTGCSNPNQPSGPVGTRLKVIGYHTLQKVEKNEGSDTTYTFTFLHEPNSDIKLSETCYHIVIDGKEYRSADAGEGKTITKFLIQEGDAKGNLPGNKKTTVKLDVTFADNSTLTSAKSINVCYWPRAYANGNEIDSYNNVFATWYATSEIKKLNKTSTDKDGSSDNT